jgi:DNA-binding response OmpR family regulator
MERCLVYGEFGRFDISDIEQPLRKPLRAIQAIRRLAYQAVRGDSMQYNLGILFQAASRIAKFNPAIQLTQNELARLAHILLAEAMICDQIRQSKKEVAVLIKPEETGIRIDNTNRTVWVDGVRVPLRGQSYDLLLGLYEYPNQLRTRREIIEHVLKEKYVETDTSQINRLNMAIHRLREKIEDDPDKPRFLFTEPGGGYRLVPDPED